ncbi:hypothetical protein V6N13_148682 [Hibiscus sabdariffa]|uniref:Uncharacterized protein n=1 Tax=Hibiscus sabdariffa TaxID=183260 RepID=A0ABR2EJP2_9ROSI
MHGNERADMGCRESDIPLIVEFESAIRNHNQIAFSSSNGAGLQDVPTFGSRPIYDTKTNIGPSNPCVGFGRNPSGHKLWLRPGLDHANWWANAAKLSSISKTQVRLTKTRKKRLGLPEPTLMKANSQLLKATSPSILRKNINLSESTTTLVWVRTEFNATDDVVLAKLQEIEVLVDLLASFH